MLSRLSRVRNLLSPGPARTIGGLWSSRRYATSAMPPVDNPPPHTGEELARAYDPPTVEEGWYAWWDKVYATHKPELSSGRSYSMVIPPPNVTGALHIGHALTISVEDALARWRRMCGDEVLWVPGLDHAGIATQTVVERKLWQESGRTRHDLGREEFVRQVWRWKEEFGGRINGQLRRLGATLAWEHEVFTLDQPRSRAVTEAFVRLFERGLLERRARVVNWCPYLRTALSDIEVDVLQVDGPTELHLPGREGPVSLGWMDTFAYPLLEWAEGVPTALGRGEASVRDKAVPHLLVSTTRLETMLGDVAVAVHPEDERYRHLIGGSVLHPLHGTRLPIVGDATLVDPRVGTGAVKITPAHDPNDLACAQRTGLPLHSPVIDQRGRMAEAAGAAFRDMDRFDAREKLRDVLEELGLYRGRAPHSLALARCSRSGDVLEPLVLPQWFLKCGAMAQRARQAVEEGEVRLFPGSHRGTWEHWMSGVEDWCVSRQLWWGHPIPAYRVVRAQGEESPRGEPGSRGTGWLVDEEGQEWVVGRTLEEAREKAGGGDVELIPDGDVLDTWFSSALFPLSCLGWPDGDAQSGLRSDMSHHYPLSVMETGADILFFWVARMMMMCTELVGEVPFKQILLHPIVRDRLGRKMSKSLGNVIDPVAVIQGKQLDDMLSELRSGNLPEREVARASETMKTEFPQGIPQCGTDALRFALANYTQQGAGINLDITRVQGFRFFCNKLWQASRFVLPHCQQGAGAGDFHPAGLGVPGVGLPRDLSAAPLPCRWILSKLARASAAANRGMGAFDLGGATAAIHGFFLHEFCDVFIEWSKAFLEESDGDSYRATLGVCLDGSLRLFHPLMPFVTEELWQHAFASKDRPVSLGLAAYPGALKDHTAAWRQESLDDVRAWLSAEKSSNPMEALVDEAAERRMAVLIDVVDAGRSVVDTAKQIAGKDGSDSRVTLECFSEEAAEEVDAHLQGIARMLRVETSRIQVEVPRGAASTTRAASLSKSFGTSGVVHVELPRNEAVVAALGKEVKLWEKRASKQAKQVEKIESRRGQPNYASTPDEIRSRDAEMLEAARAAQAAALQSLEQVSRLLEELKKGM